MTHGSMAQTHLQKKNGSRVVGLRPQGAKLGLGQGLSKPVRSGARTLRPLYRGVTGAQQRGFLLRAHRTVQPRNGGSSVSCRIQLQLKVLRNGDKVVGAGVRSSTRRNVETQMQVEENSSVAMSLVDCEDGQSRSMRFNDSCCPEFVAAQSFQRPLASYVDPPHECGRSWTAEPPYAIHRQEHAPLTGFDPLVADYCLFCSLGKIFPWCSGAGLGRPVPVVHARSAPPARLGGNPRLVGRSRPDERCPARLVPARKCGRRRRRRVQSWTAPAAGRRRPRPCPPPGGGGRPRARPRVRPPPPCSAPAAAASARGCPGCGRGWTAAAAAREARS